MLSCPEESMINRCLCCMAPLQGCGCGYLVPDPLSQDGEYMCNIGKDRDYFCEECPFLVCGECAKKGKS